MGRDADRLTERCNVGRVDHILLLYRNRENRDAAREKLTALLRIDDWDDVGGGSEGIDIVISWKSGLELVYPTRAVPAFERHLEAHGEGFYCMVFGVADLSSAMEHIRSITGRAPYALGDPPAAVFKKFDIASEAVVGMVGGVRVMLGEFKPKA
jgi:hypothetical protein